MVQTGKMVYRINRAHGLPCLGKEDLADAMEGPQLIPSVGSLCVQHGTGPPKSGLPNHIETDPHAT